MLSAPGGAACAGFHRFRRNPGWRRARTTTAHFGRPKKSLWLPTGHKRRSTGSSRKTSARTYPSLSCDRDRRFMTFSALTNKSRWSGFGTWLEFVHPGPTVAGMTAPEQTNPGAEVQKEVLLLKDHDKLDAPRSWRRKAAQGDLGPGFCVEFPRTFTQDDVEA